MHMGIFFLLMCSLGLLHTIALMTGHGFQLFMAALQMLQGCESDMYALKLDLKFEHVFFSTWWIHTVRMFSLSRLSRAEPLAQAGEESAESQLTLTGRSC